jgi:hypothetical protein
MLWLAMHAYAACRRFSALSARVKARQQELPLPWQVALLAWRTAWWPVDARCYEATNATGAEVVANR